MPSPINAAEDGADALAATRAAVAAAIQATLLVLQELRTVSQLAVHRCRRLHAAFALHLRQRLRQSQVASHCWPHLELVHILRRDVATNTESAQLFPAHPLATNTATRALKC